MWERGDVVLENEAPVIVGVHQLEPQGEVTEGGAVQASRPMGTEAPFEETEPVIEEEEDYPEEEGTEDLSEQLQGD